MPEPRSYIVRIYRRGARSLTGLVEDTARGSTASFHSMEELWSILHRSRAGRKRGSGTGASSPPDADTETS